MRPGRFFWKLFFGNALLLALTLGISIWLIVAEFDRFQANQLTPYLHNHAEALVALFEDRIASSNQFRLESLVTRVSSAQPEAVRVTIIDRHGVVLADSHADAAKMDNHLSRPEVQEAFQTGVGEGGRWSDTSSRTMKYYALRVDRDGVPVGVVRVALPVRTIAERADAGRRLLWPIGFVVLLSAIGLAIGLALLWSKRVRRLTRAAESLSSGDLGTAIPVLGHDEVAVLAHALERMRNRISSQMAAIDNQRRTWESIVHELGEGVVVADSEGRIVLANPAAARLLNCDTFNTSGFLGQSICRVEDCIAHHDLQKLLLENLVPSPAATVSGHESEEDPSLSAIRLDVQGSANPAYVLARGSEISIPYPLEPPGPGGQIQQMIPGRLLVLTEVTDVVRAIRARSDFVANASHELRTPVAAIRVAADTLLRMDFKEESEAGARFAGIIARHASRLEALVQDLLDLARVESPGARFKPSIIHLQRTLDELRARREEVLKSKNLTWRVQVAPEASQLKVNPHLLSVVLDNLVDNAIKFTPTGGEITVGTHSAGDRIIIEVRDTGCGIPPQDQSRVFERFYQVDSVRTGIGVDQRGTGLGLSIVRHAVSAMGGVVNLESTVGRGTRITVDLPRPQRSADS